MKRRFLLALTLALTSVALQPAALADDKKKKKQPSQAELIQQWKIEETQRQQAAARAAAAVSAQRRVAPPVRPMNPAMPLNAVADDNDYNIVHLYNQSGGPVQVVQVSADGSTVKDFGTIPPYGLQGNAANQLQTKAGVMWAFVADGQVLTRYTVTTAPQQDLVIRARAVAQPRPAAPKPVAQAPAPAASADGSVKVLIFNRTAAPIQVVQISPDGTAAKVYGEVPPTGANELPMPLQTFPGSNWAFTVGDDVLATHTATTAPQQQVVVRAQVAPPPRQPVAQQPAPAAAGGFVQVLIFNRTNAPFQAVQISPDGNTLKSFGEIPPTGPNDLPTTLQTRPGIEWAFIANGQVLSGHTVTAAARQQVVVQP